MNFLPNVQAGGNFANRRVGLDDMERTGSQRQLQGPGLNPGLTQNAGPGRAGQIRGLIQQQTGAMPPGGGVGGFMPTGPASPGSGGGVGLDSNAVGESFARMEELQPEKVQEALDDPNNKNEDGSYKWHMIIGSLAAGVATAVAGGGVSGFLQSGVAAAGGGFKGLLAAEETKAKRAKLEAAQNKMLADRRLKNYKTMYDAQVKAGDWAGAGNTMKVMNKLSGAGTPDAFWDDWVSDMEYRDDMEKVDGTISDYADQASAGIRAGLSPKEAWEKITTENPLLMSDAMVRKLNNLDDDAKILRRHEQHAADVIQRTVEDKMGKENAAYQEAYSSSLGRQKAAYQDFSQDIQQAAALRYEMDQDGRGSTVFTGDQWNSAAGDAGEQSRLAVGQMNDPGFDQDRYEKHLLDVMAERMATGDVAFTAESMGKFGKPMTQEELIQRLGSNYSDAFKKRLGRALQDHKKNRPGRLSETEGSQGIRGGSRDTVFDPSVVRGPQSEEAAVQLSTGKVVEAAIAAIKKTGDDGTYTLEGSTPESIIDQMAQDPAMGAELSKPGVRAMAIEALKDNEGRSMIDAIRTAETQRQAGVHEDDGGMGKLVDEKAKEILKDAGARTPRGAPGNLGRSISEDFDTDAKPNVGILGRLSPGLTESAAQARLGGRLENIQSKIEEAVAKAGGPGGAVGARVRQLTNRETFADKVARDNPLPQSSFIPEGAPPDGSGVVGPRDPRQLDPAIRAGLPGGGTPRPEVSKLSDSIEPGSPGGQSFSDQAFTFGNTTTNLNQDVVAIVNAIEQNETGGQGPKEGSTGEMLSRLQFLPETWEAWAGEHLGDPNAEATAENERKVAYLQIQKWMSQGFTDPVEIFSLWNSGHPDPNTVGSGTSSRGDGAQRFDVNEYARRGVANLEKIKGSAA